MKNRIVKKVLRIIFLVFVGVAVVGTFYFLWKKAQPVITLYELVTLHVTRLRRRPWRPERSNLVMKSLSNRKCRVSSPNC